MELVIVVRVALYQTELLHIAMINTMKGIKHLIPGTSQNETVGFGRSAGREVAVVLFAFDFLNFIAVVIHLFIPKIVMEGMGLRDVCIFKKNQKGPNVQQHFVCPNQSCV